MKVKFEQIFKVYPDGDIEPLRSIKISGVQISPGFRFSRGVRFGGIDLTLLVGKDLEIDENINGVVLLKGYY